MEKRILYFIIIILTILLTFDELRSQNLEVRTIPNKDSSQKETKQYYINNKLIGSNSDIKRIDSLMLELMTTNSSCTMSGKGCISGIVVDNDFRPMPGTTVKVEGTTFGAIVREKRGRFSISGIDPGKYYVQVTFTGFYKVKTEIEIIADITRYYYFTLIESNNIDKMILYEPIGYHMIRNTDVGKIIRYSGYDAQNIPGR